MQQQYLVARKRRRSKRTTDSRYALPVVPNQVQRDFRAGASSVWRCCWTCFRAPWWALPWVHSWIGAWCYKPCDMRSDTAA